MFRIYWGVGKDESGYPTSIYPEYRLPMTPVADYWDAIEGNPGLADTPNRLLSVRFGEYIVAGGVPQPAPRVPADAWDLGPYNNPAVRPALVRRLVGG